MSVASPSSISVDSTHSSTTGSNYEILEKRNEHLSPASAAQPGLARHYTSLQEHAGAVYRASATLGGSGSTIGAGSRREGFIWEVSENADARPGLYAELPLPPTPCTPPSMEEIMRTIAEEREARDRVPSLVSADSFPKAEPIRQLLPSSSNDHALRTAPQRPSISGVAKGVKRHMTFSRLEKQPENDEKTFANMSRRDSKAERQFQLELQKPPPDDKGAKLEPNLPPDKPAPSGKDSLKDRRKVALGESIRITLPTTMLDLPPRGRAPVMELDSIVASRPRSPKTPWIHDNRTSWQKPGFPSAADTILEDSDDPPEFLPGNDPVLSSPTLKAGKRGRARYRQPIQRLRRRWGKSSPTLSNASPASFDGDGNFPFPDQPLRIPNSPPAQDDLKAISRRSRNRGLRWSGPSSSTGTAATPDMPSSSPSWAPFSLSLSRILKPMRLRPSKSVEEVASRCRPKAADRLKIVNMPPPPDFIPPGTTRVHTPPTLETKDEVKDRLADFFFDIEDSLASSPQKHTPSTPGGIWDSDAILMSQVTDIPPSATPSDESPQGLASSPQSPSDLQPTASPYFNLARSQASPSPPAVDDAGNETWFRKRMFSVSPRRDSLVSAREAMAKLEWITPEHLPSSPLCPLHPKYVGPTPDVCVFHGHNEEVEALAVRRRQRKGSSGRRSGTMDGSGEQFGWRDMWSWGLARSRRRRRTSSGSEGGPLDTERG